MSSGAPLMLRFTFSEKVQFLAIRDTLFKVAQDSSDKTKVSGSVLATVIRENSNKMDTSVRIVRVDNATLPTSVDFVDSFRSVNDTLE